MTYLERYTQYLNVYGLRRERRKGTGKRRSPLVGVLPKKDHRYIDDLYSAGSRPYGQDFRCHAAARRAKRKRPVIIGIKMIPDHRYIINIIRWEAAVHDSSLCTPTCQPGPSRTLHPAGAVIPAHSRADTSSMSARVLQ